MLINQEGFNGVQSKGSSENLTTSKRIQSEEKICHDERIKFHLIRAPKCLDRNWYPPLTHFARHFQTIDLQHYTSWWCFYSTFFTRISILSCCLETRRVWRVLINFEWSSQKDVPLLSLGMSRTAVSQSADEKKYKINLLSKWNCIDLERGTRYTYST